MSLRPFRRRPAPAGRHSRALPGPLVPGAAAALVAAADRWDAPQGSAYAEHPAAPADPVAPPEPVAVALAPVVVQEPERVALAAPPAEPVAAAVPALVGVSLGFADGARIDLPADDPRVRTFAAAAAAMLEVPSR